MRVAYLECFSGISGNMLLGALLDAGVSEDLLRQTLASLDIGADLRISHVNRSGISSTNVEVLTEQPIHEVMHSHDHPHTHELTYEFVHSHSRAGHAKHRNDHDHNPVHRDTHHRSLSNIRELIRKADIPAPAREVALRAFEMLGEVEAKIHNVPVESIHFHEVGAVDSIADIVCGAVGCHALGVASFVCSPLNVGGGTVRCAHGEFPVPAPAALALLKGAPLYSSGIQHELVTPTGAAMIRALECHFSSFPAMTVDAIGYGAGTHNLKGHPNVLRISVGELHA
jgi:pyridinium-3,5-bisthiocarboxylic acid mononucleotide nickel chelatase